MGSVRQLYTVMTLTLIGAAFGADAADAQGVEGTVHYETTGEPLAGVLVSVLGPEGERIRGVLTDTIGRFTIEVPLGRYRLRAERIGLQTKTTETFDLDSFNMRFEWIQMAARPVEIAGLVVDSRVRSCRVDRLTATRIQRWWSEVRTALDVSAALQREQFGHFMVETFEREWDDDLLEVVASNHTFEVSVSTRPFVSAPAEELVDEGFVRGTFGRDRMYYGPDADVLVSSVFLAQHCFSLVDARERDDQLGLHFEPVEGREVTDIEGTLWIDTTTAALTDLDFRYVNLDGRESGDIGGKIVFEYLPSGAWIVSDWYIRMPKTGLRGRRARLVVIGYHDGGGSVTPLSPPEPGGPLGTIRGVVTDSLRGGGLAGAVVSVLGSSRQTVTDDDGRFRFSDIPVGSRYLAFTHDDLNLWGLGSGYFEADVDEGVSTEVELAVPGFEQTALALCLTEGVDAETVVVGHLLGPDREPRPRHEIVLVFERRAGRGGSEVQLRLRTDERGRFVVCSVPGGESVKLRADLGDRWEEITEFVAHEGQLTYREIWFTR